MNGIKVCSNEEPFTSHKVNNGVFLLLISIMIIICVYVFTVFLKLAKVCEWMISREIWRIGLSIPYKLEKYLHPLKSVLLHKNINSKILYDCRPFLCYIVFYILNNVHLRLWIFLYRHIIQPFLSSVCILCHIHFNIFFLQGGLNNRLKMCFQIGIPFILAYVISI